MFQKPGPRKVLRPVMPGKKLKSVMPRSGTVGSMGIWLLRSMRLKLFGAFGLGFCAGSLAVLRGKAEVGTTRGHTSAALRQSKIVNGVPVRAVKIPVSLR